MRTSHASQPPHTGHGSWKPTRRPATRSLGSATATTAIAAAAGGSAACIAYLLFALFVSDVYLGPGRFDNLLEVLGLAVASFVPMEAALGGWLALRRRRPAAIASAAQVLPALALCLCVFGLGLLVCALGFNSVVGYIGSRGDLAWTLLLTAATGVLLFGPWWLLWAIWRYATWVERIGVGAAVSLLGYGALRMLWFGLEQQATQRGIAHDTLTSHLPAFFFVALVCFHTPGWLFRRTRRRLDALEQPYPA